MGLSFKQVSRDGLDWSQDLLKNSQGLENPKPPAPARQQRQLKLRCPRCDSTNTKFCYYNNYSKLQPRHFCKACRRHWTNGGILRNVPVGGGRKNKRPKTSHQSTITLASDHVNSNVQLFQQQTLPSDFSIDSGSGGGSLMGSLPSLPPAAQFTSITAASIDRSNHFSNPAALFSSFLDFTGQDTAEVGDFNTITSSIAPWQQMLPSASANINSSLNGLDLSSNFWSCWDDLTGLVSPDLKHPISP